MEALICMPVSVHAGASGVGRSHIKECLLSRTRTSLHTLPRVSSSKGLRAMDFQSGLSFCVVFFFFFLLSHAT